MISRLRPAFLLAALAASAVPPAARADEEDRLFDFTDNNYKANGVSPAAIEGRRQADGVRAVAGTPPTGNQRPVRALLALPAYDHSGGPWYFTVLGGGSTALFTNDAAGRQARKLAYATPEYIFPRRGTDPTGLGAFRQSVVLDMRRGYFDNDPLGIWIHTWVSFTDQALNTAGGQKELADLARKNGTDLDGTPLIKTVGDIDRLFKKGYVTKQTAPLGSGLRYALCPVIKDPTGGGIARDQFLSIARKADGTPPEPACLANFDALRLTGEWSDN